MQRERSQALSGGAQHEDKRQQIQSEIQKILLKHQKEPFYCEVAEHGGLLRGAAESPSLELLKAQLETALTNLPPLAVL